MLSLGIISGKIRGSDRKTFDDKAKAQVKAVTAGADLFICADQEDKPPSPEPETL